MQGLCTWSRQYSEVCPQLDVDVCCFSLSASRTDLSHAYNIIFSYAKMGDRKESQYASTFVN